MERSDATKLRYARSELKEMQRMNRLLWDEINQRRIWGAMMANLCFNLAQNDAYDPTHRASMKDCRENWDKIKTTR
jgi:hypothetical protein